jgi:F420-0:gamma-glutamyl ligase-like protein
MAKVRFSPKPHADVLLRVFDLPGRGMTRALAESILALDFPEGDAVRIEELNVRANEGELTDEEEAEMEAYTKINDLLAYWQSKARRALQQPA